MDKANLLKPRLSEGTVDIPGVGEVRVRGLSRHEVMFDVNKAKGAGAVERRILALGMVDPEMTEDDVAEWMKVTHAGELEPVVEKISELSGLGEGADKEAMSTFRDEPAT